MWSWAGYARHLAGLAPDHAAADPVRTQKAVATYESKFMAQVGELRKRLSAGAGMVCAGSEGYDQARRKCFYLHDAGYPAVIVSPQTVDDVVAIVQAVAGELSPLRLSVCCGGHTGFAVVDDALTCDLSGLCNVSVDADAKTVRVGGGCKIEKVDTALAGTGLGFVTGTNNDTGVSGLTLAGGFGYLSRKHGFACDNVITATVVLFNGRVVEASDKGEYADLMRALRGGGGNFGIVVEWTFKLHDVSDCFGGLSVRLAPTEAASVASLRKWRSAHARTPLPDHSGAAAVLPSGAPVNIYLGATYESGAKDAKTYKDLDGLRYMADLGGWVELQNNVKKRDHCSDIQNMLAAVAQPSYSYTNAFALADIDDELCAKLVSLVRTEAPTKQCSLIIFRMGGAGQAKDLTERSVLGHRNSGYWVIYEGGYTRYASPSTVEAAQKWMQTVKDTLLASSGSDLPYAHGKPEDAPDQGISAHHEAYNGANKDFVCKMKAKYDPNNLFRFNKNVKPA